MTNPLTINYRSTNHYLVDCDTGMLLIDAGWAGSLPELRHALRRYGLDLAEIKYVMLTHHHPDHAGLTQKVKNACGARLLIHERQVPYLPALLAFYERKGGDYQPITIANDDIVVGDQNRAILNAIGIRGEIVATPGHSEDSVSLVLDEGIAVVGDLHLPDQVDAGQYEAIRESWRRLISLGVHTAYPAHSGPISVQAVAESL